MQMFNLCITTIIIILQANVLKFQGQHIPIYNLSFPLPHDKIE